MFTIPSNHKFKLRIVCVAAMGVVSSCKNCISSKTENNKLKNGSAVR